MAIDLAAVGKALGEGLSQMGTYSAQAAAQANAVSAAAQAAQGQFNQQSADIANAQNVQNMMSQYAFNSAQASAANQFTEGMWQRSANWNEAMWEKQAAFNAEQAQIQRDWQERMSNTQYQRAISDMSKAGLNPILAVTGGGVGTSVPGGASASVSGASMGSAQGAMASGGLVGANSASESNYTGQMEYLSGTLGLISACISGLSTAAGAAGNLGEVGESLVENAVEGIFSDQITIKPGSFADKIVKGAKDIGKWVKNKITGEKELHITRDQYDTLTRTQKRLNNDNRFKGQIFG